MTVHERCVGDVTIIDIDGRITEDGANALRALVQPLVRQGRIKIVFNLRGSPYIDTGRSVEESLLTRDQEIQSSLDLLIFCFERRFKRSISLAFELD